MRGFFYQRRRIWSATRITIIVPFRPGEKATLMEKIRLPPRFIFMESNKSCNLRCTHCDFWRRDDNDNENYLPRARKREVVAEFAEMNPRGSLRHLRRRADA